MPPYDAKPLPISGATPAAPPSPSGSAQNWRVSRDDAGARLDVFLAQRLSLGRAAIKRLLDAGLITHNGRTAAPRDKGRLLREGDDLSIAPGADSPEILPQPDLPVPILAQFDGWLILDKPAGMPVHPLSPAEGQTVLNFVAARFPGVLGVGEGGLRSGVVHRLDVHTSGALAFALAQTAWNRLRDGFASHTAIKVYHALVHGRLQGQREEKMRLLVARHHPAFVKVVERDHPSPGSRPCNLKWRALRTFPRASLLEIHLGTGFLHQIRAMLAHLGHPVVGDDLYGAPASSSSRLLEKLSPDQPARPRLMLHAARLEALGRSAVAPAPPEFQRMVEHFASQH